MEYDIICCLPIIFLLVGIIVTKKLPEMLILATILGAIIVNKGGFISGWIGYLYQVLSDDSFQFLVLILFGFGAMLTNFEKSGALLGFSEKLSKFADSQKKSLFITWLLGAIIFIDDYLNALAVATTMRNITDKHGVPREHLAYTVNSMGACMCVLIPFTSWAAFMIGVIADSDMTFIDYCHSIPFMFYPILGIICSLLLALGIIPKIGPMKKAYERVAQGGPTLPVEDGESPVDFSQSSDVKPAHFMNFIIPIAALIITMLIFDNDMIHGIFVGLAVQCIMYCVQKLATPVSFVARMMEGMSEMAGIGFICLLAFTLSKCNDELGFSEYMVGIFKTFISPSLLPLIVFVLCGFIAFTSGSFWALVVIVAPIFMPVTFELGVNPCLIVAAMMSGIALGSQSCFFADAVIMTSAGTGITPVTQVKAILPYVGIVAAISCVLFGICGFVF